MPLNQPSETADRRATVDIYRLAAQLPADAVALMTEHARHSLQLGPPWFANLEQTVFDGHPGLRYFVLRHAGCAMAILPTLTSPGGWGHRVQGLANFYTALYAPAMVSGLRAPDLTPLIDALRSQSVPLRSLNFSPMDPDTPAYQVLEAALAMRGFKTFRYFCFGNWYLPASTGWPAYLAGRTGKQRSNIKRMEQRLADAGGRIEVITSLADADRGLAAYDQVYALSWKVPEPHPLFMPSLMRLCAQHAALRLGVVWLGETPIAAQLWVVWGGRAEIFKVAYNEAHKSLSPGTVLTAALMQHVLDTDHVNEVDYLVGDDPYKRLWMTQRRERWGLIAYDRRSLTGCIGMLVESLRRHAKRCRQGLQTLLEPRWEIPR